MEGFVKKIFEGQNISPPAICKRSFELNFSEAVNVEWSQKNEQYEAIFYRNSLEHIATFSSDGNLLEYRMILPNGSLPEMIKARLEEKGEIMNQVLVNKGNAIFYEVIFRDKELNRFLAELTDLGQVIMERQL